MVIRCIRNLVIGHAHAVVVTQNAARQGAGTMFHHLSQESSAQKSCLTSPQPADPPTIHLLYYPMPARSFYRLKATNDSRHNRVTAESIQTEGKAIHPQRIITATMAHDGEIAEVLLWSHRQKEAKRWSVSWSSIRQHPCCSAQQPIGISPDDGGCGHGSHAALGEAGRVVDAQTSATRQNGRAASETTHLGS